MSIAGRASVLVAGILAALLVVTSASAQTASSTLSGTVKTVNGDPVVAAVVQARSEKTGAVRSTVTDGKGRYRLDGLPPGGWTVVARHPGGAMSESEAVILQLQQPVTLDFVVGTGYSEEVVVKADRPLVDREQTGGSLRIDGTDANNLPIAGRNYTDLVLLDSAVRQAGDGSYYGERGAVFIINGQSGRSNSFLVDGLDNNDQFSGTSPNSFLSMLAIEDVVLMTHQFAPEFGRATGGTLNAVTRGGSNQQGLEVLLQGTTDSWNNSGSFVDSLPNPDGSLTSPRGFQAGARLEGPLVKDKAFYLVSYEHQQVDDAVPYTGITRDGAEGGVVTGPSDVDALFFRTDFNLSPNNSLMLRLSANDRSAEKINVGGVVTPDAGFRIDQNNLQLGATLTSVLSPRLLSESRFLAGDSTFEQLANSDLSGVGRPSGIFGGNPLNRQERETEVFQVVQNFTMTSGSHTMKFGLDLLHSRTQITAEFNPNGNFLYDTDNPFQGGDCFDARDPMDRGCLNPILAAMAADDGTVPAPGVVGIDDNQNGREGPDSTTYDCEDGMDNDGDGLTDGADPGCIAGIDEPANIFSYPVVFTLIDGNAAALQKDTQVSLFAQDLWRVGSKWVFQYGLRYDLTTYTMPDSAVVESSIPNGGAGRDYNNLAPRFGFTYTPRRDGKVILRGGAGVFYDKLVLAFPAAAAVTSGTSIGFAFPQGFAEGVTEDFIENNGIDALPLVFPDFLTLRFSTATELETPYTVQYNLGAEIRTGRNSGFRADLIRTLGYNQPLMRDLNPVICVPDLTNVNPDCPFLPEHRDPTTGSIAAITTEGRNWYTGLDLKWRTRSPGTWFSAAYTLSMAEDLGFDPLKGTMGGIAFPPDSDNIAAERGRSDGDRLHRLVLSGEFPLHVLGLRLSGVGQYSTGVPFNVTTGRDDNLDGILSERPPGVDRNQGANSPLGPINELRTSVDVGLPPIDSLEEPVFAQIDIRIFRPFSFGKRGNANVFLQVFNLLDRTNVGLIEGRVVSQNFGQAISLAGPPRTVELGLSMGF